MRLCEHSLAWLVSQDNQKKRIHKSKKQKQGKDKCLLQDAFTDINDNGIIKSSS
jgi:hypothetical protein